MPNPMKPDQAADILLTTLRDGDYLRAVELINNDGGKPTTSDVEKLKKKIETENLQPQSWTLQAEYFGKSGGKASYYIITGKVTFKDGGSGTIRVRAEAWGLKENPWRFSEFELKR